MKISEKELASIIEGCARGDRKSQQRVFQAYYSKMLAVCMRYAKDESLAKDVLQDGFIKVFEKIGDFNMEGSFEGWVRRIVVNTAIDHFRKKRSNMTYAEEDELLEIKSNEMAEDPDAEELKDIVKPEMVMNALQELSPAYRTVFSLYVIEDYTHREIAEMLDISEGTSKSNLAKAKMNLKKIIQEKLSDEEQLR